jgi:flavodoxin
MNTCVLYFSRTGNTKRMAEAISELTKAPIFDSTSDLSVVEKYDLVFIGTPVEGFRPAKETLSLIERLPQVNNKKAVLFCTYALFKGLTFRTLEKALSKKGYCCILKVSKKGLKPNQPVDFTDSLDEIKKGIVELFN